MEGKCDGQSWFRWTGEFGLRVKREDWSEEVVIDDNEGKLESGLGG